METIIEAAAAVPERPNDGPMALGIIYTVTTIASLFVAARVYVRAAIKRQLRWDDWLVVVSIIFLWLAVAFETVAVVEGSGHSISQLSPEQIELAIFWTLIGYGPGVLAIGLPKLVVTSLLTRLLNPSRFHFYFLWVMSVFAIVLLSVCCVITFVQCSPTEAIWNLALERKCIDVRILAGFSGFTAVYCALVDLYLAVYPAVVLWQLQMNWRKKMALSIALGVGSIAAIVATYKAIRLPTLTSSDITRDTVNLAIWTCAEGDTLVMGACIPTLQPLAEYVFGRRIFASFTGSSQRTGGKTDPENSHATGSGARSRTAIGTDTQILQDCASSTSSGRNSQHDNTCNNLTKPPSRPKHASTSQESILHTRSPSPIFGMSDPSNHPVVESNIMRVDEVCISYEQALRNSSPTSRLSPPSRLEPPIPLSSLPSRPQHPMPVSVPSFGIGRANGWRP